MVTKMKKDVYDKFYKKVPQEQIEKLKIDIVELKEELNKIKTET